MSATREGRGRVLGLRVPEEARSIWFTRQWRWVTIHLPDGGPPVAARITESFWGESPVLRSPRIRGFLERYGLDRWPPGRPPHFQLEPQGSGVFALRWLEHIRGQPRLL